MTNKRKIVLGAIALVVITVLLTVSVLSFFDIPLPGGKVLVSREEYKSYKDFRKLLTVRNIIDGNFIGTYDQSKLLDSAIKGYVSALGDPYTVYMDQKEFADFETQTRGSYSGIGVVVSADSEGYIVVVSTIEDTPGEKAGIRSGDRIIAVDNKEVSAKNLDEAVNMIKGKEGTVVTLKILRKGEEKPLVLNIKRERIYLKTVKGKKLDNDIGYIRITMFDENTSKDFKKTLEDLSKENIKALIIDLRDNPGGLMDESVAIADMLLPKGVIVYTQDKQGKKEYRYSDDNKIDIPFAILVNGGSASASEILSGAVKDMKAGVVVGTKTFGKGLVQSVIPFNDGSGLKITVSKYFTPNGNDINGKGIEPDVVVELPKGLSYFDLTPDKDVQLKKAMEILREKIK